MNVILGGGIAGLWLLNRLHALDIPCVLIDTSPLGGGQTLSSQGIIHGGIKYSLSGQLSGSAKAIASMPKRWLDCLTGNGEIDLHDTRVLSDHQLMWSSQGISGKVTTFFSSKAVSSKMQRLENNQYPSIFNHTNFNGQVYQLNEPVIDVPSLLKNLTKNCQDSILQVKEYEITTRTDGSIENIIINQQHNISVSNLILTAGEGNEKLLAQLNLNRITMQRRPLQMVFVKGESLPPLYAHCVGASNKPLLTITTHHHSDGDPVWYIGGNIAEDGVNKNSKQLIEDTKLALIKQLPWLDLSDTQWQTYSVNRAELKQSGLLRPDTVSIEQYKNMFACWPTKLALAPLLADKLIDKLKGAENGTNLFSIENENKRTPFSGFSLAQPPWDHIFQ